MVMRKSSPVKAQWNPAQTVALGDEMRVKGRFAPILAIEILQGFAPI
jgi:hypothetical protein